VWEFFFLRIIVIEILSARGSPLEQESELGFISIKVSLLVLLISIFCCYVGICCNISVFSYYNTYGTLQFTISKGFPNDKYALCIFSF
jgi:hypothetical protein